MRQTFVDLVLENQEKNADDIRKFVFSDVAHFTLHTSSQIWGADILHAVNEKAIHSQPLSVNFVLRKLHCAKNNLI